MTRLVAHNGVEVEQEVRLTDSFMFYFGHGPTSGNNALIFFHIKSRYNLKRVHNAG